MKHKPTHQPLIDQLYITDTNLRHVVASNIDSVNCYFDAALKIDDILDDALYSYYVADFWQRLNSAGMAYFAHSSRWHAHSLHYVEFGLSSMQAKRACALLENVADKILHRIGIDVFEAFCQSPFEQTHPVATALSVFDKDARAIEPLAERNQAWLIQHPKLTLLHPREFKALLAHHNKTTKTPPLENTINTLCQKANTALITIMGQLNTGDSTEQHYQILTRDGVLIAHLADTQASLYPLDSDTPLYTLKFSHTNA